MSVNDFKKAMVSNPELALKVRQCKDAAELAKIAKDAGFDVKETDLTKANLGLNEKELETMVGGANATGSPACTQYHTTCYTKCQCC